MRADDYDALFALWRSIPGLGIDPVDDSREGITKYLRRNPATSFVAEEDGVLLGAILAGHDGRRGMISHTAVRPEHRGKHIAADLLDAVLAAFRAEGIRKVALVAFQTNEGGNAFWEKQGFTTRPDLIYRNRRILF